VWFFLNSVEYADFMFHLGQYNHYMYHGRKREFYEIKQSNLKLKICIFPPSVSWSWMLLMIYYVQRQCVSTPHTIRYQIVQSPWYHVTIHSV